MRRSTTIAVTLGAALTLATAASASERCDVAPAERQPQQALQHKLEAEGWRVDRVKLDDGCFEVKGIDPEGRRIEATFDPRSLMLLRSERKG